MPNKKICDMQAPSLVGRSSHSYS
ncbi:hypothetical protein TSAR_016541 [Trichomalopsis sarcophagae]|uniref:Uncharacterized protein n=1 Tax=Trichomalopsis sarcophagae TaxID=543379 RepID=A0A232ESD1_9HYME|nr:hypothetical protein TSAR_016541 [Trichomalopsis sarcophagae]